MNELGAMCGTSEADHSVSDVIGENFDFTTWQRQYFDAMEPGEFHEKAVKFAKAYPYTGNSERL